MKRLHISLRALLALLLAFLLATGAGAWYLTVTSRTPGPASGGVMGFSGYFADGDGTRQNPYQIISVDQLINLSWLQYMGYFNQESEGSVATVWLVLTQDLDMNGAVMPPIGTTKYPFLGNFNGQGHTISNFTITNISGIGHLAGDWIPPAITGGLSDLQCVGMFGVLGDKDRVYARADNRVANLNLTNLTVEAGGSNLLAGLVAGYVNGTLENVSVADSTLILSDAGAYDAGLTTNLSDYALVGCVADTADQGVALYKILDSKSGVYYPRGVDLVERGSGNTGDASVSFVLTGGGTYRFSRTGDAITTTPDTLVSAYLAEGLTLNGASGGPASEPDGGSDSDDNSGESEKPSDSSGEDSEPGDDNNGGNSEESDAHNHGETDEADNNGEIGETGDNPEETGEETPEESDGDNGNSQESDGNNDGE